MHVRRRSRRRWLVASAASLRRSLAASDPVLAGLIERLGPMSVGERERRRATTRPQDAFGALVRIVVGQQLSTKAERSIYARLVELFDGGAPTPEGLLEL